MPESSDEYTLLKNEIHLNLQIIDNSRNILFVSISAILAFGLSQNESLIFVLPYMVIIPIHLVSIENLYGAYKIGTYLMVFHEGDKYNWETRLYKLLDEKKSNTKGRFAWAIHAPYIISGIASTSFSAFFTIKDYDAYSHEFIFRICFAIIPLIFVIVFAIIKNNVSHYKQYCRDKWNEIKLSESNTLPQKR